MEETNLFISGYFGAGDGQFSPEKRHSDPKPGEHFTVEDLLDFSNEDDVMTDGFFDNITGNSTDSSTLTVVDSCNSSVSGNDTNFSANGGCRSFSEAQFSGDLCVPYDDIAELEWLSNFVEDSFSTDDGLHNLHLLSGSKPPTPDSSAQIQAHIPTRTLASPPVQPDLSPVPAKAQRSKRSRAAPCDWSSRLLHLLSPSATTSSSSSSSNPKTTSSKKNEGHNNNGGDDNGEARKCLHCAAEKTPQWRTGPMGPKTLCNACGVRFKSGRLVPEYRPAASPTFVSAKHSNSHRKVLELRRQQEMKRAQPAQQFVGQTSLFGISDGGDYLINHCSGLDYRRMI